MVATPNITDTGERIAELTNDEANYRLFYKVERIGGPGPIVTATITLD